MLGRLRRVQNKEALDIHRGVLLLLTWSITFARTARAVRWPVKGAEQSRCQRVQLVLQMICQTGRETVMILFMGSDQGSENRAKSPSAPFGF